MIRFLWGLIGGGRGSQIGPAHRLGATVDGKYDLVAAALDADPQKGKKFAIELGISKSRAYVANALRLLSLPHKIQQFVQNGDLSPGHARTLIVLPDPLPVAKFAIKKGMSVRQLESYVSYLKNDRKKRQNKINTKSPDTLLLERKLTDSLGLAVEIIQGSGEKGELKIKFLTFDQLNLVCEKIS